jgi:hypothetical protein
MRTLLASALILAYPTRRMVLRRGPAMACEGVKVLTVASGLYYPPIYPCFCTFDHRCSVFPACGLSISLVFWLITWICAYACVVRLALV